MKRWLLATAIMGLMGGAAQADYTLNILHINDFHNRIEPVSTWNSTCRPDVDDKGECFGGIARLASKISELRDGLAQAGEDVIVLDAGDQYQGSLFYTTYRGQDTVEFMKAVGFDAMAVGNHEFDNGPAGLAVLADGVDFPLVSGNLDLSGSEVLDGKISRRLVIERGEQRIGIISAIAVEMPELSSPGDQVVFSDDIESLTEDAAALAEEGVDKIIALTHVGYQRDIEIAQTIPGVDVVVGGHSHTVLGDVEGSKGPYPTMVTGTDGQEVPVVTVGAYGKYLGHLRLVWDDKGKLKEASGAPILLDASVTPDATLAARVQEMAAPIEGVRQKTVAHAGALINGSDELCRQQECDMGNLVTDAMLDHVKGQGISISIINAGAMRASIAAGPVTMGDLLSVLPFQNTLSTFDLKGQDLIAALENGASQYESGTGRFAHVGGLKYTLDPAAAKGGRISDVMVRDGADWVPIDRNAIYGVVSNEFIRNGGDGYAMLATNAINAYDFGPDLVDVVAAYLAKRGLDFKPKLDGRITIKPVVVPEG